MKKSRDGKIKTEPEERKKGRKEVEMENTIMALTIRD